eukprot:12935072-Alexandrium_andersonii.AAC.1
MVASVWSWPCRAMIRAAAAVRGRRLHRVSVLPAAGAPPWHESPITGLRWPLPGRGATPVRRR